MRKYSYQNQQHDISQYKKYKELIQKQIEENIQEKQKIQQLIKQYTTLDQKSEKQQKRQIKDQINLQEQQLNDNNNVLIQKFTHYGIKTKKIEEIGEYQYLLELQQGWFKIIQNFPNKQAFLHKAFHLEYIWWENKLIKTSTLKLLSLLTCKYEDYVEYVKVFQNWITDQKKLWLANLEQQQQQQNQQQNQYISAQKYLEQNEKKGKFTNSHKVISYSNDNSCLNCCSSAFRESELFIIVSQKDLEDDLNSNFNKSKQKQQNQQQQKLSSKTNLFVSENKIFSNNSKQSSDFNQSTTHDSDTSILLDIQDQIKQDQISSLQYIQQLSHRNQETSGILSPNMNNSDGQNFFTEVSEYAEIQQPKQFDSHFLPNIQN